MEATELIRKFEDFLEETYKTALLEKGRRKNNHLVVDFHKIIKYDTDLADLILDDPEHTLQAFNISAFKIASNLPKDFKVRLKNSPKSINIPIDEIRAEHLDSFITVEGIVKQKSGVRQRISSTIFECPSCGNRITILQIEDNFISPSKCGCGRKGKFTKLSSELIDVYSLLLEELLDHKETLTILCSTDLTNKEVEKYVVQGNKVAIAGILKSVQLGKTTKTERILEANYIKTYDESFTNIKWNVEDVKEFKKLSKKDNWLHILRKSIFYDIHGYEEESEGIILQMFGGVSAEREEGADVRGDIHCLLVGDPGSAKSSMLKITQKFHPKARYLAGKGASGVGLTAAVVKDEFLGGYTVEAGALVLCNNGMAIIDELDKMSDDDKEALHEPLEQQTCSISKGNVQCTLKSKTAVLSAANPKFGSYSRFDSVYAQIELTPTLINRFDLVYPIIDTKLTPDDHYKIAKKIHERRNFTKKKNNNNLDISFIKKYISYAKTINPSIPEIVADYIAKKYQELKKIKNQSDDEGKQSIPISGRNVEGMFRLAEAVARSRLHSIVTEEDAQIGYAKIMYSLHQVGIDPSSGHVMEEFVLPSGKKKMVHSRDIFTKVLRIIRERTLKNELADGQDIIEQLSDYDTELIDSAIHKLKKEGQIFEPKRDKFQTI